MAGGQVLIKELDPALSSFKYPDGKTDTFKFSVTPELVPSLSFTDRDLGQWRYTWNPKSNYLATEEGPKGNWTYKVGVAKEEFGVPPLSRTSSDGKTEGLTIDTKLGTYTQTGADGITTVTQVFNTPGPLYHKVKSIEQVSGKTITQVYHASYDEAGRLIRKINAKGFTTTYTYDSSGKILKHVIKPPSDPELLKQLDEKKTALLSQINVATSPEVKNSLLEKLGFFYIHDMGQPQKAIDLVPQVTSPIIAFNLQMHAFISDQSLSREDKIEKFKILLKEFPDQQQLISTIIAYKENELKKENIPHEN